MSVRTIELPLPQTAAAFERRLREAGLPVGPERAARFADALAVVRPISRRRLYWTARAVFVSDRTQLPAFDAAFFEVFGPNREFERFDEPEALSAEPVAADGAPPIEQPADASSGAELGRACRRSGITVGSIDLFIAAIAIHHGAELVTFDEDFQRIAGASKLRVKLLKRPAP